MERSLSELNLFYLVGQFPTGLSKEALHRVWGYQLDDCLSNIERLGLLDLSYQPNIALKSLLQKFAANTGRDNCNWT